MASSVKEAIKARLGRIGFISVERLANWGLMGADTKWRCLGGLRLSFRRADAPFESCNQDSVREFIIEFGCLLAVYNVPKHDKAPVRSA